MTRIAIVAAMAGELRPLVRGWRRESRPGVELWRRSHDEGEWIAACAGAGSEAVRRAIAEIERDGAIDQVISTGWAGSLREEFAVGRAYRVSGVIDARTRERFPLAVRSGDAWLVTSHRVADLAEKRHLAATSGAGLVDMEAAEVARLAERRGIPFSCLKGVSDGLADRLPDFNGFISATGEFHRVRFIRYALLRPGYWPALARMAGNSRKAAEAIRESLLDLLERSRR